MSDGSLRSVHFPVLGRPGRFSHALSYYTEGERDHRKGVKKRPTDERRLVWTTIGRGNCLECVKRLATRFFPRLQISRGQRRKDFFATTDFRLFTSIYVISHLVFKVFAAVGTGCKKTIDTFLKSSNSKSILAAQNLFGAAASFFWRIFFLLSRVNARASVAAVLTPSFLSDGDSHFPGRNTSSPNQDCLCPDQAPTACLPTCLSKPRGEVKKPPSSLLSPPLFSLGHLPPRLNGVYLRRRHWLPPPACTTIIKDMGEGEGGGTIEGHKKKPCVAN